MPQHRHQYGNGTTSDHVSIGVRGGGAANSKSARWRRSGRADRSRRISIGSIIVVLSLVLVVTFLVYYYISSDNNSKDLISYHSEDDDSKVDSDFLANITRMENFKILNFGNGSVSHGRDSRYWDRDDRRRDDDYDEDTVKHKNMDSLYEPLSGGHVTMKLKDKKGDSLGSDRDVNRSRVVGFYNEDGRDELKLYEAEYEASLKNGGKSQKEVGNSHQLSDEVDDADDHYNDAIDSGDNPKEDYDDFAHDKEYILDETKSPEGSVKESSIVFNAKTNNERIAKEVKEESILSKEASQDFDDVDAGSHHVGSHIRKSGKTSKASSKKKPRRRKFSGNCEMKLINSTHLVEPVESRKFARFSLQYTQMEEKPEGEEQWIPRFTGHQSLLEREKSFLVRDQKINCGFVKGPQGSPSTGFDLAEDDVNYISRCHIAVISCIFGNSDRLRTPAGKMVTRLSRKNACFVMFVDEVTMQTLYSEGQSPDGGFIGLWKIVVVKNLPYADMRRVGKIPKLLPHRLFPFASPAKKRRPTIQVVGFDDVEGVDTAKVELMEVVSCLQCSVNYQKLGAKLHRGVLLVGPLGTGKTLLARAVAGEAGVPFFSVSASDVEFFVDEEPSRIRDLSVWQGNLHHRLYSLTSLMQWEGSVVEVSMMNETKHLISLCSLTGIIAENEEERKKGKRYSIWLDSKLRLQRDPLQLLDYFLWRKGHEYAISNHYDRHCVWEEVAQNKKLNKYNHTVIDEQFDFYQADGLKRFNASDPNKLLPSNVPEGSFIVRAHTPMSNLFSCLWYNEVERFTPRDQLSFAYTYQKFRRTNPEKPFYLNMFKDCERRAVAKLFRHRSEEK